MSALAGRLISLAKFTVACINIGTLGYFWFQKAGFEQKMFEDVRDLEIGRAMDSSGGESFWGNGRVIPMTDDHINNVIGCMMTFAPLPEAEAQPIFEPYF